MLFGLDDHRARLDRLLRERRLVTLTGPGGTGKSALARATLAAWPGARLVDLYRSPLPHPREGGGLLILDTCDHRLDETADLVDALLTGPGEQRVLLTSREALGTIGEHVLTLPPLSPQAAAQLFRHHSGGLPGDPFTLARLEGLPLALRIAAEHLLEPPALAAALDDGSFYDLPAGPGHPSRHSSLRAAAAWSRGSCRPLDLHAWAKLATLRGPFGLAEAERALPGTAHESVARLVDKSILVVDAAAPDARWYRMPQFLRLYIVDLILG